MTYPALCTAGVARASHTRAAQSSASMVVVRLVGTDGMVGKIDASMTDRPEVDVSSVLR
jgi:hypothetical protein